jgi:hypothetical protein
MKLSQREYNTNRLQGQVFLADSGSSFQNVRCSVATVPLTWSASPAIWVGLIAANSVLLLIVEMCYLLRNIIRIAFVTY